MSISFVNGYLCETSCDVAKAKKGEDPHPKPGSDIESSGGKIDGRDASRADGPAVLFGGALAELTGADAVGALSSSANGGGGPNAAGTDAASDNARDASARWLGARIDILV